MNDRTKQLLESLRDAASGFVLATREISNGRGAAPIHAAVRQGADEVANSLLPAFPDSAKPQSELGQIFEPTPQMVTENLTGQRPDFLNDRLGSPERATERNQQRELER